MANMAEFLGNRKKQEFATGHGTEIHHRLQFIFIDGDNVRGDLSSEALAKGDTDLIEKIRKNPKIAGFFDKNSRSEVPIAGHINGKFVSRRIDRLKITPESIEFLDYKTDTTRVRRDNYVAQMKEYATLLRAAYPSHKIRGHILWLHDWELEQVI